MTASPLAPVGAILTVLVGLRPRGLLYEETPASLPIGLPAGAHANTSASPGAPKLHTGGGAQITQICAARSATSSGRARANQADIAPATRTEFLLSVISTQIRSANTTMVRGGLPTSSLGAASRALRLSPQALSVPAYLIAADAGVPSFRGAADARFCGVVAERTEVLGEALPYRPGEFYLRELPAIRMVLSGLSGLGLLVVDGYADLDPGGRPGLGAHAHAEFGIPVIGVAKSAFRTATHAVPVLRGTSVRPLFVTAAGMPRADKLARTGMPSAQLTHRQHG